MKQKKSWIKNKGFTSTLGWDVLACADNYENFMQCIMIFVEEYIL